MNLNKKSATFVVILAGIFWGVISIFINFLAKNGLTSFEICFTRTFSCAVLVLIYILIFDRSLLKIHLRDIWMFIGTGVISLTFFSMCYFTTMIKIEASIAVSLLYTSPAFIMIFAAFLFKEKIDLKKVIAIIMTVIGCALVSGFVGIGGQMKLLDLLIGVGSGFFYALYSIFARYALKKYKTLTINFYTFLFSSICFSFIIGPSGIMHILSTGPKVCFVAVFSAFLCSVLPYLFYTSGLEKLDTSVAGVLVAVEPLVGSVVGIVVFSEDSSPLKLLGIVLILLSIVISSIQKKTLVDNNREETI